MRGRINWNPIGVWPRETGVPEEACRFRVPAIKILRGTACNAWSAEKERNRVAADRVTGPRFFQHLRFLGGDLDFVKKCRTARLRHLIRKHDRERNAQSKDSWLLERILPWRQMNRQMCVIYSNIYSQFVNLSILRRFVKMFLRVAIPWIVFLADKDFFKRGSLSILCCVVNGIHGDLAFLWTFERRRLFIYLGFGVWFPR